MKTDEQLEVVAKQMAALSVRCAAVERGQTTMEDLRNGIGQVAWAVGVLCHLMVAEKGRV